MRRGDDTGDVWFPRRRRRRRREGKRCRSGGGRGRIISDGIYRGIQVIYRGRLILAFDGRKFTKGRGSNKSRRKPGRIETVGPYVERRTQSNFRRFLPDGLFLFSIESEFVKHVIKTFTDKPKSSNLKSIIPDSPLF